MTDHIGSTATGKRPTGRPVSPSVPAFTVSRLLLVGSGSLGVSDLPFWIDWLRYAYPRMSQRVVLTRSAERFVTRAALAARAGCDVDVDVWPAEPTWPARHVEWADWAEAIVVYPATFHFVARLALGLADSPALLTAQCTTAVVGLAPALPPGGPTSAGYEMHRAALAKRPNVVVAPPRPAISVTTGRADGWSAAPLPDLLRLVERRRNQPGTATSAQPTPPGGPAESTAANPLTPARPGSRP